MEHSVKEIKLKNGVAGLIIDVPNANVTSFDIIFRAGDYLSPDGKTDTAHVLEHLVLGANKKYPSSREFNKEFTKYGAYNNAYTGDYHMGYEAECEAGETERILDLLCVAIESPLFTEKEFKAEIGNVREELKMRRNNDDVELSLKLENAMGLVPKSFTERVKELDNITLKDIENHYKKTHKASNLRFIIAGPIKNIVTRLTKRLENIDLAPGKDIIKLPTENPIALKEVLQTQNSNLENLCYRCEIALPLFKKSINRYSMNALFDLLFNGFQSRVFGELREKGLAYGIFGGSYDTKDYTMININGQVQSDNLIELFTILERELVDIYENGLKENELEELKRRTYGEFRRYHQTVSQLSGWYRNAYTMRQEIEDFQLFESKLSEVSEDSIREATSMIIKSKIRGVGVMYNPHNKPKLIELKTMLLSHLS